MYRYGLTSQTCKVKQTCESSVLKSWIWPAVTSLLHIDVFHPIISLCACTYHESLARLIWYLLIVYSEISCSNIWWEGFSFLGDGQLIVLCKALAYLCTTNLFWSIFVHFEIAFRFFWSVLACLSVLLPCGNVWSTSWMNAFRQSWLRVDCPFTIRSEIGIAKVTRLKQGGILFLPGVSQEFRQKHFSGIQIHYCLQRSAKFAPLRLFWQLVTSVQVVQAFCPRSRLLPCSFLSSGLHSAAFTSHICAQALLIFHRERGDHTCKTMWTEVLLSDTIMESSCLSSADETWWIIACGSNVRCMQALQFVCKDSATVASCTDL